MILEELKWDTGFLGYPVARLDTDGRQYEDGLLQELTRPFRLVYVMSPDPLISTNLFCGDTKVVFSKKTMDHGADDHVIDVSDSQVAMAKKIGRQSGIWSRFSLDDHFEKGVFERLYDTWVERSIRKEIAFKALTIMEKDALSGLITLGESGPKSPSIGLFAVADGFRGRGIGKQLLRAADTISFKRGYPRINVATQGKNRVAREVYERFGFEVISETYIYNYWNEAFAVQ
jgi:dTDP-4-amino-4,6-dideoxy-D-galactose acyltransferase